MTRPDLTDDELQDLFDAARDVPVPDPAFLRRLEEDAVASLAPPMRRDSWNLRDVLGGWLGASGLASACLVGLWVGIAPPDGLPDPVAILELALMGDSTAWDALPGLDQIDWNLEGGDDV